MPLPRQLARAGLTALPLLLAGCKAEETHEAAPSAPC